MVVRFDTPLTNTSVPDTDFELGFGDARSSMLKVLPGGHSEREPPDPIPNSEVKTLSADDSLGSPHVKVGHCRASIANPVDLGRRGFFSPALEGCQVERARHSVAWTRDGAGLVFGGSIALAWSHVRRKGAGVAPGLCGARRARSPEAGWVFAMQPVVECRGTGGAHVRG